MPAQQTATAEIKQKDRQFVPNVLVVQVGTRLLFPNEDAAFHRIFSRTPGTAFDVGTLKTGDRSKPVLLANPGLVEIFCAIHPKMRADVMVVPNQYFTRVKPDGSFRISRVPSGTYRVVLWGPAITPISQRVQVTGQGAPPISFTYPLPAPPRTNQRTQEVYDE